MTNNKSPFGPIDPLDIFSLSPAAQRLQAVLYEADSLKRKDDIERLLGERLAGQVQAEQEELQLSIEREEFDRIEREEMARLSARAKWEASQQPPQATPERPRILLDLRPGLKERSTQLRDRANAIETARLAKLAELEAERYFHESEATRKQAAPAQTAATPAPVVADDAPEKQIDAMKRAALIAVLEYEWPSIEADIREATRNGLKAAAHTGKHGEWDKDKARAWAVSKGKIKQTAPVHSLAGAWPGTTTRHTISR